MIIDKPYIPHQIIIFPNIKGIDKPIWEEYRKEHYDSPIKSNGLSEYYESPKVPRNAFLRFLKKIKNFWSDSERKQIKRNAWIRIHHANKIVKIEDYPLHTTYFYDICYIDHTLNKVVRGKFTGKEIYELYNREVEWRKEHNQPFKFPYDRNRSRIVAIKNGRCRISPPIYSEDCDDLDFDSLLDDDSLLDK